jgi:gas vesicle protein
MAIFGAILVGAGLGPLFAPKPGRELRDDLRRKRG